MEAAIAPSNAAQCSEYAMRLANILRNDIYKEDNILFEMVGSKLTSEDDAQVLEEFKAFDRDFEATRKRLLERLRILEWRYLRKIA